MTSSPIRFTSFTVLAIGSAIAGCSADKPDDPPGPNIKSFSALPTSVAQGNKTTLSWEVENTNTVSIVAMPGGTLVNASTSLMGSMESGELDVDTMFKLTATGAGGKTKEQTVSVTIDHARLTIARFEAVPNPAPRDGTTELRWQTEGATGVTIKNGNEVILTAPANMVAQGAVTSPRLTEATYTFTIEATNGSERITRNVTLTADLAPAITAFSVTPSVFTGATQQVMVAWTTTNASTLRLLANGAEVTNFPRTTASGTWPLTIMGTTLFELVATSGGGEVHQRTTVARTAPEVEPNDTYAEATPLATGAATGEIADIGDTDVYSFEVPQNGNVFASVKNTDGSCPFDSILILLGPDGTELGRIDDGDGDLCADLDPRNLNFLAGLDAGTYYLAVRAYSGAGPYTLVVITGAAGCGNGVYEMGEQCDDNNTSDGDNCSETCQFEIAATVNPPGGNITINTGAFSPAAAAGSFKWVQINLTTAGQSIEVQTGDVGGGCTLDTYLLLISGQIEGLGQAGNLSQDCAKISFPQDTFAIGLPVGTYYLLVANDNMTDPATISVTITIHDPGCGNGAKEMGEQCDDGNMTGGDGCTASCAIESIDMLMGPPAEQTFSGSIVPGSQEDYYTLILDAPGYIDAETFAPTAPTCTPTTTDTVLTLFDDTFNELQENDEAFPTSCSHLVASEATQRPAGTYYLRVISFVGVNGPLEIPAYELAVRLIPLGCGNGFSEPGEQCEDGNTASGDGCSATCTLETIGTISGPPANQVLTDSIDPATATDFYTVTLTAPAYIDVQVGSPTVQTCTPTTTDTLVEILSTTDLTVLASADDINFNTNRCSHLIPGPSDLFAPGDYYMAIRTYNSVPVNYQARVRLIEPGCGNNVLETGEQCDDGNTANGDLCSGICEFEGTFETEVNDTAAQANASGATRNNTVLLGASISPVGDVDFFSFTITGAAASVRARTHTDPADPAVCASGTDSHIFLYDSAGTELADNDDIVSLVNLCSEINGIDGTAMGAENLPAGTYYVAVHRYHDLAEIPGYFLSIELQ